MSALSEEPTVSNLEVFLRSVVNTDNQSPIYTHFSNKTLCEYMKVINEEARTEFGKKVIADLNRHTVLMNERMEGK